MILPIFREQTAILLKPGKRVSFWPRLVFEQSLLVTQCLASRDLDTTPVLLLISLPRFLLPLLPVVAVVVLAIVVAGLAYGGKGYLDALADLLRGGYGEVEYHLHHDGDTAESLREMILEHLQLLAGHGHLSRDPDGRIRYAFIHGNWSLANGRSDGRWCGVDNEVEVLWDTGCYVDMTFPSAPDECQPNIVNQIYWPTGDLSRRRCYEHGQRARVGARMDDRIVLMQGPIALALRPGKLSVRIESAAIDDCDPPSAARVRTWTEQNVHVDGRPEWVFVKLHTHGCPEQNAAVLLGPDGHVLHRTLTEQYNDGENWVLQ